MLHFLPVTIESRQEIDAFFKKSPYRNCDFSFSNIFCWKHRYDTSYCIEEGFLFIRFRTSSRRYAYLLPLGEGPLVRGLELIRQDAYERNDQFLLFGITEKMFEEIESVMPDTFIFQPERDWFEYLYEADSLITLSGKKLQSKRNHINKFKRTYPDFDYLPITRDIIPECLALYKRWCRENGGCEEDISLREERIATQMAFTYFEDLHLQGGAIRANGEILAYSYGQALNADTFDVQAEKSLHSINGGFTIINQQFAEHVCAQYSYVNREEDLGLESLRKAKLSYQPAILLVKGFIRLKHK